MKWPLLAAILLLSGSASGADGAAPSARDATPGLLFTGVVFEPRGAQGNLHEYTPAGQEDLDHWTEMMSIIYYPAVQDGNGLAAIANAVLGNYQKSGGKAIGAHSVPRTAEKEAEHFCAVLFVRPEFCETAFARLKLINGVGTGMVYSHRIYGPKAGPPMLAWLKENGMATETALMAWDGIPPYTFPAAPPVTQLIVPIVPVIMHGADEKAAPPDPGAAPAAGSALGPDRTPAEALQGAADSPDGLIGRFVLEVRAAAVNDHMLYLNSETDYRDPRNLTIAVTETAAAGLAAKLGDDPATVLLGKKIRVIGIAKKTKIWFTFHGVQTDKYYYQTQLRVVAPELIEVLPP